MDTLNCLGELNKQREIGQTERDRLGDGAVRFAQLSQKVQGEAIRAQQLAQSGRASELTGDQRDLLNRIGTRNAVSAVRRADIADANQSGFSRFFGQGERDIIDRSIKQQTQIASQQAIVQAQIADQTKISVELAQDADKLAAKVMQRVRQTLDARDKRMLAILAKDREVSRAEQTDKLNVAVAQLRGSGAR